MNKPDWRGAPLWANFLALGPYGQWLWFESEPRWDAYLGKWMGGCRTSDAGTFYQNDMLEHRPNMSKSDEECAGEEDFFTACGDEDCGGRCVDPG